MFSKKEIKKIKEFFPTEKNFNKILYKKDFNFLSQKLESFYPILIQNLKKPYERNFKIKNTEIILRRCLIPLSYIFFDRCIRSILHKKKFNTKKIKYNFREFNKIEDFEEMSSFSIDFNYFLNLNFLSLLKNKNIKKSKNIKIRNNFQKFESKQNLNYLPIYYNFQKKLQNFLFRKIEKIVNFFFFKKKFLILGAANSEPALVNKFIYIFKLSRFTDLKFEESTFDKKIRQKLFSGLDNFYNNFTKIFKRYRLSKIHLKSLYNNYIVFLEKNFPKFFLEDFCQNYLICKNYLEKFEKKIILSSDNDNSLSTMLFLVAKNRGFKNIKLQHGGHYGYVKNKSGFENEIEFKNCDEYLTYGWKTKLRNSFNENINFIPMPSPWLSEKKSYFANFNLNIRKKYDFIFFPQNIKPFTNSVHDTSKFSRDVLEEYLNNINQIAKICHHNKLKIGLKFYNKTSEYFLNQTLKKLKKNYKNCINIIPNNHKGISKDILKKTNLIVFDQIGTGALECFNYGIPVMILHNSTFNIPNKNSICLYKKLHDVGILHYKTGSLFEEYEKFNNSPILWLKKSGRQKAINNFCKNFGLTDINWSIKFNDYLSKLN